MAIDWRAFCDIVDQHERFVLTSHVRPDADAIGSEVGLAELLESQGKTVRIVNPSPITDALLFLDPDGRVEAIGEDVEVASACDTDVHVVLDTSAWVQVQGVGEVLRTTKALKVVIDHHQSSDDLGAVEFKDTSAEATGRLIVDLAESAGWKISPVAANALFCAIATDTGWFRFSSTNGGTLKAVGRLIDLGAQPHLLYPQLYERCSQARVRLNGRLLERMELACDGRLAWLTARSEDFACTGAVPADTEDVVNGCFRIVGVECAFIAHEQRDGRVKVSFRSRGDVDVAAVAEQFDGGGHRQASGAVLDGPFEQGLSQLIDALTDALQSPTRN
ncbi:MAG: phosphoesterase [Planctomycetaceae bacterium]|nr:phosphoesterase [Planctomycetaceae bacterium]|tara:strand:- start:3259 stop:4257 length:999 start_codon:yes stop_codon:yes gene_type:complete